MEEKTRFGSLISIKFSDEAYAKLLFIAKHYEPRNQSSSPRSILENLIEEEFQRQIKQKEKKIFQKCIEKSGQRRQYVVYEEKRGHKVF